MFFIKTWIHTRTSQNQPLVDLCPTTLFVEPDLGLDWRMLHTKFGPQSPNLEKNLKSYAKQCKIGFEVLLKERVQCFSSFDEELLFSCNILQL